MTMPDKNEPPSEQEIQDALAYADLKIFKGSAYRVLARALCSEREKVKRIEAEAYNRAAQHFNDLAQLADESGHPEKGRTFLECEDWCREWADDAQAIRSTPPEEKL